MNWDATTIAAWAALAGVVISLSCFAWETRHARRSMAADLQYRFESEFHSPAYRTKRCEAAKFLLQERANSGSQLPSVRQDKSGVTRVYEVFDFFERIAAFTRSGVMDRELVWAHFIYWLVGYWNCAGAVIAEKRQSDGDPTLWAWSEDLVYDLGALDRYYSMCSAWLRSRPNLQRNYKRFPYAPLTPLVSTWFRFRAHRAANSGAEMHVGKEKFLREEADLGSFKDTILSSA